MTDLRRSTKTATAIKDSSRIPQQSQATFRDPYGTKCNNMPDSFSKSLSASNSTAPASLLNGVQQLQQQQQHPHNRHNPLLTNLNGDCQTGSISEGSTTSSTATTATAATVGHSNWNGNTNGNMTIDMMLPLKGEIQFDEREIYYVTTPATVVSAAVPSCSTTPLAERKGSFSMSSTNPVASTRSLRAFERLRSLSPTSVTNVVAAGAGAGMGAGIAPTYPALSGSRPYSTLQRSLTAQHETSFDSYEISSHYSDTAMQALRSGSSSSSLAAQSSNQQQQQQHHQQQQQPRTQNSVTFSNYVSSQYPVNIVNGHTSNNNNIGGGSNRGSLRRTKGRSNQSLCSCDAGAETEINPDPTRPLYQYSLERSGSGSVQKMHTYTCEQNAQILMRLERERHRRLSLVEGVEGSKDELHSDTQSSLDVDIIPPVPPPPAVKRNGSLRSLRLFQTQTHSKHQQQQHHHHERPLSRCSNSSYNNSSSISNNNNNSNVAHMNSNNSNSSGNYNSQHNNSNNNNVTLTTLCSGGDLLADCKTTGTSSSIMDVGSVIDDCTASILKCANAVGSEIMGTTTGNHKSTVATLATIASSAKPDVCHVGNHATTSFGKFNNSSSSLQQCHTHDDIFMPNSKKTDPALCFLHAGPDGVVGMGPDLSKSRNSKYNTIGPSSDYVRRQLSLYNQKQQQLQHHSHQQRQRITERCRCFSQSLSNFSRDYFGQQQKQQQLQQQQQSHVVDLNHSKQSNVFHAEQQQQYDWLNNGGGNSSSNNCEGGIILLPPPPVISRSYSNLFDIDGHQLNDGNTTTMHHHQKFHTPADIFSSSCSFGNGNIKLFNDASFATLNSSTKSGLKEKLHQQQKQQQQHQLHHIHRHEHHLTSHPHLKSQLQQQHNHYHHQLQSHLSASTLSLQQQQKHQLHSSSLSSIMPWKHRQCPSRGSSSSGTNSFRFDAAKHWLAVSSILLIIGAASVAVPLALRVAASAPFEERLRVAVQLLDAVPLIDGHNDLPWNIRKFLHNKLNDFNFDEDLRNVMPWARSHWSHTDLQRLKKGRVSAQFWAAYVPCEAQHRDAVQLTLEQIDVIKRLTDRYSPQLTTCTSSDDIIEAHKNHQLCSLTGVEGGHSLGGSLAVLRTLYAIGVRYVTLTSTCHTPWADSSYADAPTYNVKHGGLTAFGKTIIQEMNRLGMMVDLSHVSTGTMRDALEVSEAPVIFSHSSAYELCNSSRNVQDDMLQSLAKNGGLVMVNFYSKFLSCSENSTVHDAVAHINHIKRIAGIDHVGLGAGYDGINFTPKGLEDVSSYPTLFAELLGGGWSIDDLTKLAGGNFLRVMKEVEKIRDDKKAAGVKPFEDHPNFRTEDPYNCTSS